MGNIKRDCPTLNETRAVPEGECINSPMSLESHSPVEQPSIDTSKEKEAEKLTKGT